MEMLTTLHMGQGGDDCSINICGLAPNVGIVNVAPPPFGREFMVVERSIGKERKNSGIRGEGCALLRYPGGSRGWFASHLAVQDTTTAVGEGEGRRERNLERRAIAISKQNYA